MNIEAIQEAITLLTRKRFDISSGAHRPWEILKNAANHLDKEISEYLKGE